MFIFLLAAIISAVITLYNFRPAEGGLYPPCVFHLVTGFYCPGCGALRALHSLLHGELIKAAGYNPFAVAALPFIIYSFISYGFLAFGGKRLPSPFIKPVFIWMLLAAIIIFWVMRNIPAHPFTILAP